MITIYSLKTRLAAARAILDAKTYDAQKDALKHWTVFMEVSMPLIRGNEDILFHVEHLYEALRCEAITWYLSYLEARIESLEAPNGGRLGHDR